MLASASAAPSGGRRPRFELVPPYQATTADELFDLLALLDMPLLDWQRRFLADMLGEDAHGRWSASEVCLIVPRQNGKSYVMAARILAGLFLTGEKLITYTAHRVDTALEIFNLVDRLARSHPDTKRLIKKTVRTGGKETMEMIDGRRFKILARSRSTGRGFSGDCLIFDEALELRDQNSINALLPTLATYDNAQLIYASSAGDSGSAVLAGVRDRGHAGQDTSLLLWEYAADRDADLDDETGWVEANPGCPELISIIAIQRERERMSLEGFRQERLGIWSHELSRTIIPGSAWDMTKRVVDQAPEPGRLGIAFDVSTDRGWSSIIAAWNAGGRIHVRTSRHDHGDQWLVPELAALAARWRVPITYDDAGPARDIGEALRLAGVEVDPLGGRDFAAACARLVSGLVSSSITHEPFEPLDRAAATASARSVGEGWAFARRNAAVPICPITASALAVWAVDHVGLSLVPRPAIF